MTFLITGATGNVGRHLMAELLGSGRNVRALTRNPEAELPPGVERVVGDLTRPETWGDALSGVTGLHLLGGDDNGPLAAAPEILERAAKEGVRRVTVLWNGQSGPAEAALEEGNFAWTRLEPTEFMSNTLGWAALVREEGLVREPFPEEPAAVVHEADIAAVAAVALTEDGHDGAVYPISGPEVLTTVDRVRVLGRVLGRDLRYVELTKEQAKERMRAAGHAEQVVDFVIGWHADPPPAGRTVVPTVEQVTGRPARTFAQWVEEHAAVFSSR
ncbi:NAD(P)H-binding protein [Actinocorallia sp. B10E7]|uniref:NAD(P)H-binding protein n=1 Tax=Actinocorallia sp. B10E7 TaxID=3153558 RepID=UPI00325D77F4